MVYVGYGIAILALAVIIWLGLKNRSNIVSGGGGSSENAKGEKFRKSQD